MLFSQTRMHKSHRAWKRACQWTWGKKKRFLLSRRNIDADSAMTRTALLILYSINLPRIHELVPARNHSCPWIWRMWEEAFRRYRRIRWASTRVITRIVKLLRWTMGTSIIDAAGICLIPKSGIKTIGRSVHFRIQHLLRGSIFNDIRRESITRDSNLSPGEKNVSSMTL